MSGFGFQVSIFGFRVSISGLWVSGFGLWVSGFGLGDSSSPSSFGYVAWREKLRDVKPVSDTDWRADDLLSFSGYRYAIEA